MICKDCPEGRRFAEGSVYCILYGMIIRETHICTRDGGNRHEGESNHGGDGVGAVPEMPGLLRGSGE